MFKTLELKPEVVDQYLNKKDYTSLANYLNESFKLERTSDGVPLQYEFSESSLGSLSNVLLTFTKEKICEEHKNVLKALFRSLRNYVINLNVKDHLTKDIDLLRNVKIIFDLSAAEVPEVLQVILQFLINFIISNEIGAHKVYSVFKDVFSLLEQKICITEITALMYNISIFHKIFVEFEILDVIMELYGTYCNVEFLHFLLEKFITYDYFWFHYKKFDLNKRLVILGLIRHKQIEGETLNLPLECVQNLVQYFVGAGNIIFQTVTTNENNLEPYEVSQLLQIISSLCGSHEYLKLLQNDKDLLINCGVLLINIHQLGKETKNYFSSIQSLSEIREPNKGISDHPAFGFKADLIRIIGNLCWKNKTMQDLTREAELIPVMLDCCNMDARNPFIMQWVILSIRNLCENNPENQKLIAELHQEGTVSPAVLEEMGLTLHSDGDNTIKIVPLEVHHKSK